MKGDFTRRTFTPQKHYSSVQMQQGRVQLDSDWNEEVDIIDHRWRATLEDTIGPNGAPKVNGGFAISAVAGPNGEDLILTPGRLYVDGILCELDAPYLTGTIINPAGTVAVSGVIAGETTLAPNRWVDVADVTGKSIAQAMIGTVTPPAAGGATSTLNLAPVIGVLPGAGTQIRVSPIVTYLTQPDLKSPPAIDMTTPPNQYFGKTYIAYVDAFQRHLTALDDPGIREVALNGPDTGTRTRTTWQVRLVEVDSTSTCADLILPADPPPAADQFAAPVASTGRMRARAVPTSDPTQDCLLPAEAGYRRLENQLYRVEIHQPGGYGTATFKWSRDNGSVVVPFTGSPKADQITVDWTPQDAAEGFASGQWVELTDDLRDLSPDGSILGTFVRLGMPNGNTLSIDLTTNTGSVTFSDFSGHPKVRRWESNPIKVDAVGTDGWIGLEDGVEVQFEGADPKAWFNKGDYWWIPARTATTDVEWPNDPPGVPVGLRAHGVEHYFCALALIQVHTGGQLTVLDCRPKFPALTAITAADVNYDNTSCQLINATNVQQALDALCKARDLAHHNRLIHGYGIVCGLQLQCNSTPGMWVTVKSGYAVDCNGNDIELDDTPVDLGQAIGSIQPSPLDQSGNGEVALVIGLDQNAQPGITAETYNPQQSSGVEEVFGGTLLLDFFDDCIKPIQQFMQAEAAKLGDQKLITGGQELRSAFVNLVAQGPNPQAGQNVYISGKEHQLLSAFYTDLKAKLTSDTFCALFENARPYPATAADTTLPHIFGTGQQTRIKWRPGMPASARELFTISNGNDPTKIQPRLNRYNADSRSLIAQIDPTGGATTGPIVDFTFSPDGSSVYVILNSAANKTDTFYRAGKITSGGVEWGQLITLKGTRLAAIEHFPPNTSPRLLAVETGKGVYLIEPNAVASPLSLLQPGFKAFGQVAMSRFAEAVVAVVPYSKGGPSTYEFVRVFEFTAQGPKWKDIALPHSGSDMVAWGGISGLDLYVVSGDASKSITVYTRNTKGDWSPIKEPTAIPVDSCPIYVTSATSKSAGGGVLWASQDFYALNLIDGTTRQAVEGWRLPMQVGPVGLAYSPSRAQLAVLHRPSDSILLIPEQLIGRTKATIALTQKVLNRSVNYHKAAVEAYVDLLAGFLQYLKDCFFDHVTVKCAECNPRNEKLYLGVVSIRSHQAHSVCNFSGRHYLKTFPTIGYWMSLFPIVPIIGELVELVACFVIPDAAAKYNVPPYSKPVAGSTAPWSLSGLFNTWQEMQDLDVRARLDQLLQRIRLSANVALMAAGFSGTKLPAAPGPTGLVAGTSTVSAVGAFTKLGLTAHTQTFTPSLGPQLLGNLVDVFRQPSGPITLHESSGKVLFASNPPAAQPVVASMQQQIDAKDQQLKQMQAQLDTVNAQLTDLQKFRQQVSKQLPTIKG